MAVSQLLENVEADLRALSAEAKRSEGVTGHLTGWFSGPEHPHVKDAAERTMLKLRSFSGRETPPTPEEATKVGPLLRLTAAYSSWPRPRPHNTSRTLRLGRG